MATFYTRFIVCSHIPRYPVRDDVDDDYKNKLSSTRDSSSTNNRRRSRRQNLWMGIARSLVVEHKCWKGCCSILGCARESNWNSLDQTRAIVIPASHKFIFNGNSAILLNHTSIGKEGPVGKGESSKLTVVMSRGREKSEIAIFTATPIPYPIGMEELLVYGWWSIPEKKHRQK